MKTSENEMISQRHLFDIPDHISYFNCSYNSPMLVESRRRLVTGVESKCHPWERKPVDFFNDAESIRTLAAQIFGGKPDNYAIVPSASYGISTAARALKPLLKPDEGILLLEEEFPSNVLPWKRVAKEKKLHIQTVEKPGDENWTDAVLNSIKKNTKIIAISSCHWTNGAKLNLGQISKTAKQNDSILVIDATQSLGADRIDLDLIQPDFLISAGYKWLLSPYGFSLLYVSEKWFDSRPLEESWLARTNAENFTELVKYSEEYMPGARKFDVGEKNTPTILPGAIAAFEQLKDWGISNISNYTMKINSVIKNELQNHGFTLLPDPYSSPHILGATLPQGRYQNIVKDLQTKNIYISQRGSSIRFAPHMHVNENDMDRLFDTIRSIH